MVPQKEPPSNPPEPDVQKSELDGATDRPEHLDGTGFIKTERTSQMLLAEFLPFAECG